MKDIKKKWMVQIEDAQYEWVKDTAEHAEVSGAAVVRALITRAMATDSVEFRKSLLSMNTQTELLKLEEKQTKIAEKMEELRLKLKATSKEKVIA